MRSLQLIANRRHLHDPTKSVPFCCSIRTATFSYSISVMHQEASVGPADAHLLERMPLSISQLEETYVEKLVLIIPQKNRKVMHSQIW